MEKNEASLSPGQGDDLKALMAIVTALRPFPRDAQQRIVNSALTLLGTPGSTVSDASREPSTPLPPPSGVSTGSAPLPGDAPPRDIREFGRQKEPRTAIERAALVAYYLAKYAPAEERKDSITSADVTRYFEHAGFLQPADPLMTLVNGKNAGYFDPVGDGKYRLNPVGLNLVSHHLPKKAGAGAMPRPRRRKPHSAGSGKPKTKPPATRRKR